MAWRIIMCFGEHSPGRTDIWANFEKARHALPAAGAEHGIGTPEQLRTHLRHFEESGVDQTVFIQQGGRNRHRAHLRGARTVRRAR